MRMLQFGIAERVIFRNHAGHPYAALQCELVLGQCLALAQLSCRRSDHAVLLAVVSMPCLKLRVPFWVAPVEAPIADPALRTI